MNMVYLQQLLVGYHKRNGDPISHFMDTLQDPLKSVYFVVLKMNMVYCQQLLLKMRGLVDP